MPLIKRGSSGQAPHDPEAPRSSAPADQLLTGGASERWAAARALGQDAESVPLLAAALATETAAEVREAIFTSLVLIRSPAAAEALAGVLRSDDAQLRTGALDGLGAMMDIARPLLPALLSDSDPDVRLLSCELVRGLAPAQVTALLSTLLETETHANVCGAAIDVLSEAGTRRAERVLSSCAARFQDDAYLAFAIADAIERVSTRPADDE